MNYLTKSLICYEGCGPWSRDCHPQQVAVGDCTTVYLLIFAVYKFFAIFANEPWTAKINTREICPGTVSLPVSDHDPTDSHLLDPKSHQEHRHTHTDACSYT